MAAYEPYDVLSTKTADYDYTLEIEAKGNVVEEVLKNQVVHRTDNLTREVITININPKFSVEWDWGILTESESGTVFDLYYDSAKANARENSFKWNGHDGHTYVVVFDCDLSRTGRLVSAWGISKLRLELIGKRPDA